MERFTNVPLTLEQLRYELPEGSIARYPINERGASRLLVYDGSVIDSHFSDLSSFLPENSMLVFNNTKVINARIQFFRSTGSKIEIFCLEPFSPREITEAFSSKKEVTWSCLIGNLKRWKLDEVLVKEILLNDVNVVVSAFLVEKGSSSHLVRFEWNNDDFSFSEVLGALGSLPIPPYLGRDTEEVDEERYQTVYSRHKGSVAAPTAGLHFTQSILDELIRRGHRLNYLTLHVGAGTFKPIKSDNISAHEMHEELFVVRKSFLEDILNHQNKIIAIGTTSVRTIESLYWLGVKLTRGDVDLKVNQWFAYENESAISKEDSLNALLAYMTVNGLDVFEASTSIMIIPGYKFRIVDAIVTNFHQPESTLLLLVSAFIGYENCMNIYAHAIRFGYKFLSYGDSSLLFPTVVN